MMASQHLTGVVRVFCCNAEVLLLVFFVCNTLWLNTAENEHNGYFAISVVNSWGACPDENNKPGTVPSILM